MLNSSAYSLFDTHKSKGNHCVSFLCCGYGVWEMLPVAISPMETNSRIPSLPLIRARPLVHKPSIYYSSKMKWYTHCMTLEYKFFSCGILSSIFVSCSNTVKTFFSFCKALLLSNTVLFPVLSCAVPAQMWINFNKSKITAKLLITFIFIEIMAVKADIQIADNGPFYKKLRKLLLLVSCGSYNTANGEKSNLVL